MTNLIRRPLHLTASILAAALLAFGLTQAADAGKPRAATDVTAKIVDSGLKGKVKSVPACEKGRKVKLIQERIGGGRDVIKSDRADSRGRYAMGQVEFDPEQGKAYVEAAEKEKASVVCKRGRSQRLF